MKRLSFCITCKNRLTQISKTLAKNLNDNYKDKDIIEFVIVDFDSNDGLESFILENFNEFLLQGYLRYLKTSALDGWHMSITKNTSHYFGSGEILVNLDCDNFTGVQGGKFVISQFDTFGDDIILHQFSQKWMDGSCGRIAVLKRNFNKVGGYDESFEPMGHQDLDLIQRMVRYGFHYINHPNGKYNAALANSKSLGIKFCNTKYTWDEMKIINEKKSKENLIQNKLVANNGLYGIRKNIFELINGQFIAK